MPSAEAEAEAAAMDNAVDVWRLITASRLQYAAPRRMRLAAEPIIPRAATLRRGGSLFWEAVM